MGKILDSHYFCSQLGVMYLEFLGTLIVFYIENKIFMKIVVFERVRSGAKKVAEERYRYILLLVQ
jgi:hypothetical protein